MASTFLSLQIGLSSLQASTLGAQTAGHNIANASTDGYARETTNVQTAVSLPVFTDHYNYLGQGVNGNGQSRVSDASVNSQYRDNNSSQSYWGLKDTEIGYVQQIFNEPTGTTLRQSVDNFFSSWNQLAQNPADYGARAAALQASQSLTDSFHVTANALTQDFNRYQSELSAGTSEVNTLAQSIADLNQQIVKATTRGAAPNDLLDQRSALLDQLSGYAKITTQAQADGSVTVSLNLNQGTSTFAPASSAALVTGGSVTATVSSTAASATATGSTPATVNVADLFDQGGQLSAMYDMANYVSDPATGKGVLDQLNQLASEVVKTVNTQYSQGYDLNGNTGMSLFVGTNLTASNIQVDPGLTTSTLDQIAASGTNTAGGQNQTDGTNAAAIANLYSTYDQGTGAVSYSSIVSQLGIDGAAAHEQNQTFTALTTQVTQLRQSISGVNINEEMANLVRYQQQYNASAQFVNVFNQMLTTLIQEV